MSIFQKIADSLSQGRSVLLVSVIDSSGSVPREAGAHLAVYDDGSHEGTIGGGMVEYAAILKARALHREQANSFIPSFVEKHHLDNAEAANKGMICGGNVTLYYQYFEQADIFQQIAAAERSNRESWLFMQIREGSRGSLGLVGWDKEQKSRILAYEGENEKIELPAELPQRSLLLERGSYRLYLERCSEESRVLIFGGGHVMQALVPVLHGVHFKTVVYEDRQEFLNHDIFPPSTELVWGDFENIHAALTFAKGDYVVIATRGHLSDLEVLAQVLKEELRYVGMMGSKRKVAAVHAALRERGFDTADIARVYSPIGLDIASETPEEIAISIAAELIRVRATGR